MFRPSRQMFAVSVLLASSSAIASSPYWNNTWTFDLKAYRPSANTDIRIDSDRLGRGTSLDFEQDLNLEESKTLPELDVTYRFNDRHRIEVSYFSLDRNGNTTLDGDIQIGDTNFTASSVISSDFNTDIWRMSYGYTPWNGPDYQFGFTVGLHVIRIEVDAKGTLGAVKETVDGDIPMPVVGASGAWEFSRDWTLEGGIQYFAIDLDNVDGSMTNATVGLGWQAWDNGGFTLGYMYYDIDADGEKNSLNGSFNFSYDGPYLGARFNF